MRKFYLPFRVMLLLGLPNLATATEPGMEVTKNGNTARVRWSLTASGIPNSLSNRTWQLQSATNLQGWSDAGAPYLSDSRSSGITGVNLPATGDRGFFRLKITDQPAYLASGGAEVFGYGTALLEKAAANSTLRPADIPALYPAAPALNGIGFDPTTADFWTEWNTDPAVYNATLPPNSPDRRLSDFRPNAAELAQLTQHGFTVSERRGSIGFTDLYYRIWTDDLPVYVTSDSLFHAWHRTWITMLEEIEELWVREHLQTFLGNLDQAIPATGGLAFVNQASADAKLQVLVARQLLHDPNVAFPSNPASLARKAEAAIGMDSDFPIYGGFHSIDWTQFAPRAHYTNSTDLEHYFRAMMWLGQIDFRLDQPATDQSLRELGAAVVMTLRMQENGLMDDWEQIDSVITRFLGNADSLTPPQLMEILAAEGITSVSSLTSPAQLATLLARIQAGQAGVQQILGSPIPAPLSETKLVLPRSFLLFGRRFTPESWAMGNFVFDNIWRENPDPNGPPVVRIHRRLPSALDVNFAVMGNNTPAALLAERMQNPGVPYRDGFDFSRELVSMRQVMDSQGPEAWTGPVYNHVLGAIRTLSKPLPASAPQAMRTQAWQWKTVQTQLAAWTELRHDNLLYAKQSYTPPVLCFYPAGYIEPRPAFYSAMQQLALAAKAALQPMEMTGVWSRHYDSPYSYDLNVDRAARKSQWLQHLDEMAGTCGTLQELAESEVAHVPFTPGQTDFLQGTVQATAGSYNSSGRTYSGWYPKLYLQSVFAGNFDPHPSEKWDPLVADIHTDSPDGVFTEDPGAILYNATGNAALLLVAVDVNGDKCLYGGPSFTYYEFTRPLDQPRLNDQDWKTQVRNKLQPAHPAWTQDFLTPEPIDIPAGIN